MMATENQTRTIAEAALRRLPLYHRILKDRLEAGLVYASSTDIASELGLDSTQVRKDLETTGVIGRPKVGFVTRDLIIGIEHFLGWNNTKDAFLVGAGHLGAALLGYEKFRECGMSIVAAFDQDQAKIGQQLHGREILPLQQLPVLAQRMHVHIGVITVPAAAAQDVANMMVDAGILAIWNFAPVRLRLPESLIVHNEDLYCSLASLSQKLDRLLRPPDASASSN
jgi:redox-sensing transcriptional repressor